jgi:hypothetical protein
VATVEKLMNVYRVRGLDRSLVKLVMDSGALLLPVAEMTYDTCAIA